MQNTAKDLRNHLFAQLERLGDENLTDDQVDTEVKRAKAVTNRRGQGHRARQAGARRRAARRRVSQRPAARRAARRPDRKWGGRR